MNILHSKIVGDSNKNIIIVHGFLGMGDNWISQANKIAESGFKVHLIDLRNHGKSFWSNEFSFDLMVEDIYEYITYHNISNLYMIGHSMGGNISMLFAKNYPELLKKIIIVDIVPKAYKPHHDFILESLKSLDFNIIKSRNDADSQLSKLISDKRVRQFLLKNLYWKDQDTLGLKINLEILFKFKNKLSLVFKEDFSFKKPTLFIHGENSNYVEESDYDLMSSYFKNLEIVKVPSASHWVHADNPKFFLEKTINFLN
ncbi:MAG: alpha/beta fold hydrolase [Bacteroidetes bacterium]|nr:alpha/beta fold hydrolase [Bacteroidota bacterium]